MRTLIVLPQILSRPSGTPLNVAMMCRALADEGYQVHVLTIGSRQPALVEGCVLHQAPRLPFVPEVPVGFSLQKIVYNVIIAIMLIGLLLSLRPKVVHAVEESAFYAIALARLFGATAIMDLDSDLQAQLRDSGSTVGRALAAIGRSRIGIADQRLNREAMGIHQIRRPLPGLQQPWRVHLVAMGPGHKKNVRRRHQGHTLLHD